MSRKISTRFPAAFLVLYAILLCYINSKLFGDFVPSGPTGLWILASFAPMMVAELLVRSFISAPSDSAANSLVAITTVLSLSGIEEFHGSTMGFLRAILFVSASAFFASLIAIWFERMRRQELLRQSAALVSSNLGSPKLLFTLIHFYVLYTMHINADYFYLLALIWIAVVFGRPLEGLADGFQNLYEIWKGFKQKANVIGDIISRSHPGLLTMQVDKEEHPEINSLVIVITSKSYSQAGIVLDNYRLSDELWSKVLILKEKIPNRSLPEIKGPRNVALSCSDDVGKQLLGNDYKEKLARVIGSVIERSDINQIRIELYRENTSISEGKMLSVKIRDQDVLYQVTNGITEIEGLQKSNSHGFMQITARKVGFWNHKNDSLEQVSWTPDIYSPVSLSHEEESSFTPECIGFLPGTQFGLQVDCDDLVTHNTAILGVLGSGKTSLAVELISRMVADGIKVWIIDITGEYEKLLCDFVDIPRQEKCEEYINREIRGLVNHANQDVGSGGSHLKFAELIGSYIRDFIKDDDWFVRILNPNTFRVTEQTSFIDRNSRTAGIADLTPAQITRIVSEQILLQLRGNVPEQRRHCLVLEEAHSLIPEWNSAADKRDQNASNGTARAVMQGRKYGFGCLLITQRTANVTKSILNQCNTMFALQIFDDTGKEFLQNYFGEEYASMLPALQSRHCVAYGRGLNAKTPVLIELNDSEEVRNHFGVPKEPTAATDT